MSKDGTLRARAELNFTDSRLKEVLTEKSKEEVEAKKPSAVRRGLAKSGDVIAK